MSRIAVLSLLLVAGCAMPLAPTTDHEQRTPAGVLVHTEVEVDLSAIDAAWRDVQACSGYGGKASEVWIDNDCIPDDGANGSGIFYDPGHLDWVYGFNYPNGDARICPDLAALRHEYSHYAHWRLFPGDWGKDRSRWCWL